MSGYYNGADDDGLMVGMTALAYRIDDARAEFADAVREADTSPVLRAMLAGLAGVGALPVPEPPAAPVKPVRAAQEPRQLGWSAKRRRGQA